MHLGSPRRVPEPIALRRPTSIKDEDEITRMEKAIDVAQRAIEKLIPRIKLGQSEKKIAAMLTQELIEAGGHSAGRLSIHRLSRAQCRFAPCGAKPTGRFKPAIYW